MPTASRSLFRRRPVDGPAATRRWRANQLIQAMQNCLKVESIVVRETDCVAPRIVETLPANPALITGLDLLAVHTVTRCVPSEWYPPLLDLS